MEMDQQIVFCIFKQYYHQFGVVFCWAGCINILRKTSGSFTCKCPTIFAAKSVNVSVCCQAQNAFLKKRKSLFGINSCLLQLKTMWKCKPKQELCKVKVI